MHACRCSYKYLNSGPGGIAGAYVHENNAWASSEAYTGWWGVDPKTRFRMDYGMRVRENNRTVQNRPVQNRTKVCERRNEKACAAHSS